MVDIVTRKAIFVWWGAGALFFASINVDDISVKLTYDNFFFNQILLVALTNPFLNPGGWLEEKTACIERFRYGMMIESIAFENEF